MVPIPILSRIILNMKTEHSGIGGLYFILSSFICACISMFILNISFSSQVIAMADNLAYITAINSASYSYLADEPDYTSTNPSIVLDDGTIYNPLNDFNRMLENTGVARTTCTSVVVTWDADAETCKVQFGSFENNLGSVITPHSQESHIIH